MLDGRTVRFSWLCWCGQLLQQAFYFNRVMCQICCFPILPAQIQTSLMTVVGLIPNTRAVSLIPLAFMAMLTILAFTSDIQPFD